MCLEYATVLFKAVPDPVVGTLYEHSCDHLCRDDSLTLLYRVAAELAASPIKSQAPRIIAYHAWFPYRIPTF